MGSNSITSIVFLVVLWLTFLCVVQGSPFHENDDELVAEPAPAPYLDELHETEADQDENNEDKRSVEAAVPPGMHLMADGSFMEGASHDESDLASDEQHERHLERRALDVIEALDNSEEFENETANGNMTDTVAKLDEDVANMAENEVVLDEAEETADTDENNNNETPEEEAKKLELEDRKIIKAVQRHQLLTKVLNSFSKLYENIKRVLDAEDLGDIDMDSFEIGGPGPASGGTVEFEAIVAQ